MHNLSRVLFYRTNSRAIDLSVCGTALTLANFCVPFKFKLDAQTRARESLRASNGVWLDNGTRACVCVCDELVILESHARFKEKEHDARARECARE